MPVAPGARIGVYEVVSLIGSGGMGEVYLARDTQLGRNVALKVLPDMFASDTERLARFRREAQVLAALHHPNIAVIHGLEDGPAESGHSVKALVLEYIEGDTIAERIGAGRIPLDEVLGIARQIAEALQAAHDQGVIHRDLKPSNIKLTPDGAVKVLDFGLAKLGTPVEAVAGAGSAVSLSPTITSPAATTLGVILGTAAYMAPEQAKGKPADKRSDVWAFGCVLFEMLSGRRAFEGDDISETLASVIKGEPDWTALPTDTPPAVRTLLRSCMTKDPRARLADIAGAMFVLRHNDSLVLTAPAATTAAPVGRRWSWGLIGVAALLLAAVIAVSGWIGWKLRKDDPLHLALTTFGLSLSEGEAFTNAGRHLVALSPDGRRLVYAAGQRLNLRSMSDLNAVPIRGTEGLGPSSPRGPFFSHDGEWVGYWTTGELRKIPVHGGAPVVVTKISGVQAMGAHWSDDNTIVFATPDGIWKVPAGGGSPEMLIKSSGNRRFQHPQLLPGGKALLFTALDPKRTNAWSLADIIVKPLDGGAEKRVANGGDARYVPTGHLVFVVNGTLMAVPFDSATLTAGDPVALREPVAEANTNSGAFHFDVSASGTLVYVTATGTIGDLYTPVWIDRKGRETPLDTEPRPYRYVRVSGDNTRAAFDVEGDNRDIWIWNVGQNAMSRLTTDTAPDRAPVFSRDGRRIIYSRDIDGLPALFWQSADGVDKPEQLTHGTDAMFAMTTAPDGTVLVRRSNGSQGGASADIYAMPLDGDRAQKPLINDPQFLEQNAEVSHNGRWLAYQTNKSGRDEIFVRPYPALNTESPVSTVGGSQPLWSADDRELFFRSPTGAIMRVRVAAGDTFTASTPEQVLPGDGLRSGLQNAPYRTYDVSRDGLRFLVLKGVASQQRAPTAPGMIVVQNFAEELKRRVRAK